MLAYGFMLLKGANLLSDGSELLLEVLNPGIIGGGQLPVSSCQCCTEFLVT